MSSVDKYGLKEVADVMFVKLDDSTKNKPITATLNDAGDGLNFYIGDELVGDNGSIVPAFTFDTLKTSNIEVASEETSAKGGKGNPELISWSYGKTATLTVTDALLSLNTLGMLFGAKEFKSGAVEDTLTIDANTFPDTYIILGTTVLRPFAGGKDEPFGLIVPKAKVNVGGTLTMEAEGDPSTFEMSIKALAATLGTEKDVLLKFVKPATAARENFYYAELNRGDTTGITINIPNATSVVGSNDITCTVANEVVTIKDAATAGSSNAIAGSVYLITVKNADSEVIGTINLKIKPAV